MSIPIVLVADDEWLIADSLAMILNRSGFQATPVHSIKEAVETAMELKPDFLVCDVCMGGMAGIDAAIHIHNICPQCKVILCSANLGGEALAEGARAEGHSFEFLMKPFHPTVLLRQLKADA